MGHMINVGWDPTENLVCVCSEHQISGGFSDLVWPSHSLAADGNIRVVVVQLQYWQEVKRLKRKSSSETLRSEDDKHPLKTTENFHPAAKHAELCWGSEFKRDLQLKGSIEQQSSKVTSELFITFSLTRVWSGSSQKFGFNTCTMWIALVVFWPLTWSYGSHGPDICWIIEGWHCDCV